MKEAVVKIDGDLLKEVEEFINRKANKIAYSSKKHFVNMAVLEKLKKEEEKR
jgi:hypothetical protein